MGYKFIESWASYASTADITRRWPYQSGNGGVLSGGKLVVDGSVTSYCNTRVGILKTIHIGMNVNFVSRTPTVGNSSFLHICNQGETNAENTIGLGMNPDGTISVFYGVNFSGYGGTTLANGTTVVPTGSEVWIEVEVVQSKTTAGSVTVKLNGAAEIALTGIRTNPSIYEFCYVVSLVAAGGAVHNFGSLFISDGSEGWTGPAQASRVLLTADTAKKDFTASSGADNYSLLNDLNVGTTYVTSGDLSASDLYSVAALPTTPSSIFAVQLRAKALQNDAANMRKALVPVMKSGANSVGRGGAVAPSSLPETWSKEPLMIAPLAPGGGAWSVAELAALSAGFRVSPFVKGFNFRSTSGYVTDSALCTYVLNDAYPTTRGGVTFGWDSAGTGTVKVDRTTSNAKYSGINCQLNDGTQRTFRIDVPAAGRYQIRLMVGDYGYNQRQAYVQVLDGSTALFTIDSTAISGIVTAAQSAIDAGGVDEYGMTAWEEYNAAREITLSGTVLNIKIGSPAAGLDWTCIAHVEVVALDLENSLSALTPDMRVSGLYAEVLHYPLSTLAAARPQVFVCT